MKSLVGRSVLGILMAFFFIAFPVVAHSESIEVDGISSFPYQARVSVVRIGEDYNVTCEDQYLDSASIRIPMRELRSTLHTLTGWVMLNRIDKVKETKQVNSFIKFFGLDSGYTFAQFNINGVICSVDGKGLESLYRKIF